MNRNQRKNTKGVFLPEIQNLFKWKFFLGCVMVASLLLILFKMWVIVTRGCVIVMAKISIINISPEILIFYVSIFSLKISIFSPSTEAPFSPPLIGHAHPRKENTPICGSTSTLITFKIRRLPRTLFTPPSRHHPIPFTVLVLNAAEVKIGLVLVNWLGSGQKPRKLTAAWFFITRKNIDTKKSIFAITTVSLWLVICNNDTQKMLSHFTLVLESGLSNVLETYTRAAWLLNLSIKKKSGKIAN